MTKTAHTNSDWPEFDSPEFLTAHVKSILAFYRNTAFDPSGGFFHFFLDDGQIYDRDTRHLVSSTRLVFNYAQAHLRYGDEEYQRWARHGFDYLLSHHQHSSGHFIWQRNGSHIEDGRAMAYGHAFVLLAGAWAHRLKLPKAEALITSVWDFMEEYFYEAEHHAYADERDESLKTLSDYRGQNANMHSVEACLAAYEATSDQKFFNRADLIAKKFTVTLAAMADGQVWEHYDLNWKQDWTYNIDKPDDLFKPWGFQPGHQLEWAKLLLQLERHHPSDWRVDVAIRLYSKAMEYGWDKEYGGLVYGYAPDKSFADATKYFWVQAEAIAAAWRLYSLTGDTRYYQDYIQLWKWSWKHLVDHEYGGWYRIVSREGNKVEPYKSPAGKVDYHTMGACWDVLDVMAHKAK